MMTRLLLAVALFVVTGGVSAEGESSIEKDINNLASPSAPAFTILDLSPASIARSHSPRELSIGILTAAGESNSTIPENLSIEFAPYWWKSRPNISFNDYVNDPNLANRIKRSASISIASSSKTSNEITSTDLAFGLRFNIVNGDPSTSTAELVKSQLAVATVFGDNPDCIADVESDACKKATEKTEKELDIAITKFRKSSDIRTGFQSDMAIAFAYSFPENDTSEGDLSSSAIWFNTSYTPIKSSNGGFQYLGLIKYLNSEDAEGKSNKSFDLGVRAIWKHGVQPIAFSIEYLNRFKSEEKDAKRYSGIIEYKINDTLNFVASFGKNFEEEGRDDDLFVIGGVSFNFGTGPSIEFNK